MLVLLKENHASTVPKLVQVENAFELNCFYQAMGLDIEPELGALSNFALDFDGASHFLYDVFTDG